MDLNSDLAAILESTPRRQIIFDLGKVDLGKLTLLELLDASHAAEIDPEKFREALDNPATQARLFYAIAWVILRRVEHDLTYDETCDFDLIPLGEFAEDVSGLQEAKAVVAVASLAGVSPAEAKQLTMDEVSAVTNLAEERMKAQRRASRRARR